MLTKYTMHTGAMSFDVQHHDKIFWNKDTWRHRQLVILPVDPHTTRRRIFRFHTRDSRPKWQCIGNRVHLISGCKVLYAWQMSLWQRSSVWTHLCRIINQEQPDTGTGYAGCSFNHLIAKNCMSVDIIAGQTALSSFRNTLMKEDGKLNQKFAQQLR